MDREMRVRDARQDDEREIARPQRREAGNSRQGGQGEEEFALDELVDIIRIILTEESRPVPMKKYLRIVDVDKVLHFLSSMERQMPGDILEARRIREERDDIIESARRRADSIFSDAESRARVAMEDAEKSAQATVAEAENRAAQIVDEAQKQARVLIDQNQVRRLAEEEAQKLMANARSKASTVVRQATDYADQMLNGLEDFLNSELSAVRSSRDNIHQNHRDAQTNVGGQSK